MEIIKDIDKDSNISAVEAICNIRDLLWRVYRYCKSNAKTFAKTQAVNNIIGSVIVNTVDSLADIDSLFDSSVSAE